MAHHEPCPVVFQPDHGDSHRQHLQHSSWASIGHSLPPLDPPEAGALLQTVITHATPPQLYHGPIDLDSWFPILFGLERPHQVSRVSLVTSDGAPHRTGLPRPLSNMDTLPESVEVYRASPFLPPEHLGRVIRSGPPLTLSGCSPDPNHVGKRTVYVHLHFHAGYSPLHSVLGSGTCRISLCVLCTNDRLSWTPTLYQSEIPSKESTRPTNRVLLLAGILRGLWEPHPEADVRDLDIYLPD